GRGSSSRSERNGASRCADCRGGTVTAPRKRRERSGGATLWKRSVAFPPTPATGGFAANLCRSARPAPADEYHARPEQAQPEQAQQPEREARARDGEGTPP